jgi:hypothetical protein
MLLPLQNPPVSTKSYRDLSRSSHVRQIYLLQALERAELFSVPFGLHSSLGKVQKGDNGIE